MPVDAPPRPVDLDTHARREWLVVLVAAVAVGAAGWLLASYTPEHVEISIENPTENDLTLLAHAPGEESVTVIGNVERGDIRRLQAVLDQGSTWVIELRYAGVTVDELSVERSELEAGWTIPAEVGDKVAEAGFTPSAP
jgi:hypothetical protein